MIDWLSFSCEIAHDDVVGGYTSHMDAYRNIIYTACHYAQHKGSYDATLNYRVHAGILSVSGCPAKYLQGHNLFGSNSVAGLTRALLINMGLIDVVNIDTIRYSRIDITDNYTLESRNMVREVLRTMGLTINRRWSGRGRYIGSTLYIGSLQRIQHKIYCKGDEICKHKMLVNDDRLLQYADKVLRWETTIGRKLLHELGNANSYYNIDSVIHDLRAKEMLDNVTISSQSDCVVSYLPRALRATYALWYAGVDCRGLLSKSTYYRHRGLLLQYGVDIDLPRPTACLQVLPRLVELVPDGVPEWAIDTSLYFEPAVAA